MLRRRRLVLISLVLMGLAVAVAPDSRESGSAAAGDGAQSRVGPVQGSEAFIAVRYDGRRLRAYACNGSARRPATLSKWFEARWDGREPVTMVNGDSTLRVERLHADGRISGRLDGRTFTATPATGPGGLHERDGRRTIVLADGSQRGTMISPRPPKCRFVLVTGPGGRQQWVAVC
jgi:hypothetical protein